VQTFVCMNMSVCIGSGCFYVIYVCIYIIVCRYLEYLESITQALCVMDSNCLPWAR
jgi:hypothetical protein